MATLQGIYLKTRKAVFSQNILSSVVSFVSDVVINIVSSAIDSTVAYSTERGYRKAFEGSLRVYNSSALEALVFNFNTSLQRTVHMTGKYIFSIELMHNMPSSQMFPDTLKVKLKRNGVFTDEIMCTLNVDDTDIPHYGGYWGTYCQTLLLNSLEVIDFEFELITEPTKPLGSSLIWVDGLKLEFDNKQLSIPTVYSEPTGL